MVIFEFSTNNHQTRIFVQRIFGDKAYFKLFESAFKISRKICNIDNATSNSYNNLKRPYIYISLDLKQTFDDKLLRMRTYIFKRNITFKFGG